MKLETPYSSVLIDIDNTLTRLAPTLAQMASYFNRPLLTEDDIMSFELTSGYGISKEANQEFWDTQEFSIITQSELALERVSTFLANYTDEFTDIHIVTNRDSHYLVETKQWLDSNVVPYSSLACIGKQSKLQWMLEHLHPIDAVFEDNPKFFYELWDEGLFSTVDTYAIDYPYNWGVPSKFRLDRQTGKRIAVPHFVSD